jgi:hypothetical protein
MASPYILGDEEEDFYDDEYGPFPEQLSEEDFWELAAPGGEAVAQQWEMPAYVRQPGGRGAQFWQDEYGVAPDASEIARATQMSPYGLYTTPGGGMEPRTAFDPAHGLTPLAKLGMSAQEMMDAMDYLSAASPDITQAEAEELLYQTHRPDEFAKAAAGIHQGAFRTAESLTSPINLGLMVGTAGLSEIPLAARALAAAFGLDIGSHVGELAREAGEAYESGDTERLSRALTELGTSAAFTTQAGRHATRSPRAIPGEIREAFGKRGFEPSDNPRVREIEEALNRQTGEPNAIQEPSAAEVYGRLQEQSRIDEGPLPAQEGAAGVPQRELSAPGDAGRPLSPEEARRREVSLTEGPIPTDPVERANFEQDLIDHGVAHNQEQGLGSEWRTATPEEAADGGRWIASVAEDGTVVINREPFRQWLDKVKPEDRLQAMQAMFSEEGIHGVARKWVTDENGQQRRVVTDEEAADLYKGLSDAEKALVRKSYGEIRPEDVPAGASAEMMYGHEHLRRNMQRLLREPVREVAEAKGYKWLTEKAIDLIERVVLGARRLVGSKSSKQLDAMLNRLKDHVDAARKSKGMEPVDWDSKLAGAPAAIEGAPRALVPKDPGEGEPPLIPGLQGKSFANTVKAFEDMPATDANGYKGKNGFNMTGLAWDLGSMAKTAEDVALLKKMAEESTARGLEMMKTGDMQGAMNIMGKQHGEAYEFATGVKVDGTPKWTTFEKFVKGYKPPVPDPKYTAAKAAEASGVAGAPRAMEKTKEKAREARDNFVSLASRVRNAFGTRGNKQISAATKDAADNQARIMSDQSRNGLVLEAKKGFKDDYEQALKAVLPVIESGGDVAKLADFIAQTQGKPGATQAREAAQFAAKHWEAMQPLAERFRAETTRQRAMEEAAGLKVEERQNYFPHIFDVNKLPDRGAEFFPSQGAGGGSAKFRARRSFNTIYDAIEAGYGPAIKSMHAGDVLQQRVKNGAQRVMDKAWVDSLRTLDDPTTGTPLITDVTVDPNGVMLAPAGYEVKTVLNGPPVAVHQGYGKFIDSLTGQSQVGAFEVAGLPVGEGLLKGAAFIKHGTLLFDTFHASRMMQKAAFLHPTKFGPQVVNPRTFGKKGVSLLEYADSDLAEAVRQGDISPQIADWVRANRPQANLLIKRGLNVGQVHEALRAEIVKHVPVLGKYLSGFNGWVFQKVSRGALMEAGLLEMDRVQKANPSWSQEKVADKVAKDLNTYFGNLGRQGTFKSKTFQDLSRLILLAPNWFESMLRSEVYGYGQLGKAAVSTAAGKPKVGSIGRGMAGGLLAYFIGTQILNLVTRGTPTWNNPEEGHKLDAWIPDVTGKTPGFFLSPMSVPAEITHDFLRYRRNKGDESLEGAWQIAKNKMSPYSRAAYTLATGDTYRGKVGGTANRLKAAGAALVPVPIAAGGFLSDKAGQTQRQLTASMGFKTEPAETPKQRMRAVHNRWLANNPDPKLRAAYERDKLNPLPESQYRNLDSAVRYRDQKTALAELQKLRATVSDKDIVKRMFPVIGRMFSTDPRSRRQPKPLFHESAETEHKFRESLTEKQREVYDQALEDRKEDYQFFLEVWRERGPRPEVEEEAGP